MTMNTIPLRTDLPPIPLRMRSLPVFRGYPVPWFVEWIEQPDKTREPDFRITDGRKMARAHREKRCWVCGELLGIRLAFVIGPMCAINRISGEPPAHRDCAEFSAQACPFLSTPKERRREDRLPPGVVFSETGLKRNPGVAMVWITREYRV